MAGDTPQPAATTVQAIQDACSQLEQLRAAMEAQRLARQRNLSPQRPDDAALARLDSSIKKNSAFTKRLRLQLGEAAAQRQLLDDIRKLNQSKYVSELVKAVVEAPLRATDAPAAAEVCAALHQRHADFAPGLAQALAKTFGAKLPGEEDRALLRRQRAALRLLAELLTAGVVTDPAPLISLVRELASADFAADREGAQNAAQLLGSFAKTAGQLLGAPPEGLASIPARELLQRGSTTDSDESAGPGTEDALQRLQAAQQALKEEDAKRWRLPEAEAGALQRALDRGLASASKQLTQEHAALAALEQSGGGRGMGDEAAAEYETRRKAFEALFRAVSSLAEALGKPVPEFAEDEFTRLGAADSGAGANPGTAASDGPQPLFEDPATRAFYEDLPDLRALVPAVLLADAVGSSGGGGGGAGGGGSNAGAPTEQSSGGDGATTAAPAAAAGGQGQASDSGAPDVAVDAADGEDDVGGAAAAPAVGGGNPAREVDAVLHRLGWCVSRDLCDELTVNFCYHNSKAARRRLVRALVDVPRGQLQLLPYYARVAATLSQLYPDVGAGVLSAVEGEFDALAAKDDPNPNPAALEARCRWARYLGELVKFRLAEPTPVLLRVRALLDDFSGAHIDLATSLVEAAGRFLIRNPESRMRMENVLEVMMRLKNVRNLDTRHAAAVDNAYFATKPPAGGRARRRRPPIEEYIRHLVFEVLDGPTIALVLKKLMKLPWAEHELHVLKCLVKVVRMRASNTALVASLAGGLSQYHASLGVALVDAVLEEMRWGLDHPAAGTYQKRLAECRLLGELYNYMLLDSTTVFDVLYLLLGYGHDDEAARARLDPPDDFFRVRMVIVLLSTCGQYFSKGAARRRLDRFLTFLQLYCLTKSKLLPLDVEFDLQDLLASLRPGLERFSTHAEAAAAVQAILAVEAAAAAQGLDPIGEEDDDGEEEEEEEERGALAAGAGDAAADAAGPEGVSGEGEEDYDRGDASDGIDDEFEREFASLMQGNSAATAAGPAPAAASSAGAASATAATDDGGGGGGGGGGSVALRLLMRRGGKDDKSRELRVPASAPIAQHLLQREQSEAAERSAIKRLVLEANTRDVEREQQETAGAGRFGGGRGGAQQKQHASAPRRAGVGSYYTRGGGRGGGLL